MKFVTVLGLVVSALQLCELTPVGAQHICLQLWAQVTDKTSYKQNFGFPINRT